MLEKANLSRSAQNEYDSMKNAALERFFEVFFKKALTGDRKIRLIALRCPDSSVGRAED